MLSLLLVAAAALSGTAAAPMQIFGAAQTGEVYRLVLGRDALLLESVQDAIKQKGVRDGQVFVSSGSVQECTYHYVMSAAAKPKNGFRTVKGAFEILNAGGIIADGDPHIHITLSSAGRRAFGGHLEKGCRVLYLAEITIVSFRGPPLTRAENENGVSLLKAKE